jgi:hypothetical protein
LPCLTLLGGGDAAVSGGVFHGYLAEVVALVVVTDQDDVLAFDDPEVPDAQQYGGGRYLARSTPTN